MATSIPELLQAAMAAVQAGDLTRATQNAEAVLRADPNEPNALLILGGLRGQAGDHRGALDVLERANTLVPGKLQILTNLGATYRALGRLSEARAVLEQARHIDRRFLPVLWNLGNTLIGLNDRAGAKDAYEALVALQPKSADGFAALADIAEKEHRLDDARRLAERALSLSPALVTGHLTLARVEFRERDYEATFKRLDALRDKPEVTLVNRAIAEGLIGQALEKLGDFEGAFAAFKVSNKILFEIYSPRFAADKGPTSLDAVKRMTAFAKTTNVANWTPCPSTAQRAPVFLIGFPRSGTTLLDQVLASHPHVVTLEEKDCLFKACQPVIAGEPGVEALPQLSAEAIETYRASYWSLIDAETGPRKEGSVFVDKMPLNTILLPIIYRLFPDAHILFALRDPRDVVVSCFQQRFGMSAAMFQMLQLDMTVRYYDAVMNLANTARTAFPLRVHELKYESLISDFDSTVRNALDFLALEWSSAVQNYAETARGRTIATPSASQVVQPLYSSSQGKWHNYKAHLQPYLPSLNRWVKAFGYAEN